MVLVVGPSGAGKDTLMSGLKSRLAGRVDIHFARRLITREADTDAEDHDSLTPAEFDQLAATENTALHWQAHGHGYVIPKSYDRLIEAGATVIANGSRRILNHASNKYQNAHVVLVTAPIPVLAERLAARSRETAEEIERRLSRANLEPDPIANLIRIENTGTVASGVGAMIKGLRL
ncbi:phosphonate metabolism protein/1,5-bisphosphokinase (PRPP-forming) PhnN [Roseibium denhamense]|nr:phosphonate metabolism protein/1,5-bisphosphokinase (PRPP-forming) PhnN [Roseibium denhamense]